MIAFSPDGKRLAAQPHIGRGIRVWDGATGRPLSSAPSAEPTPVDFIAFLPKGKHVVTRNLRGAPRLWDAATGRLLHTFTEPESNHYFKGAPGVSPDGTTLLQCMDQVGRRECVTWDVVARTPYRAIEGQGGRSFFPAFLPDGKTLLTATRGPEKWRKEGLGIHGRPSPTVVASKSRIAFWDHSQGKELRSILTDAEFDNLKQLVVSPDGKTLAGAAEAIYVWDLSSGRQRCRIDQVFMGAMPLVGFSADGRTLVTGPVHHDKEAYCLWEVATGKERGRGPRPTTPYAAPAAFDGGRLLAVSDEEIISLIDFGTGRELRRIRSPEGASSCLAFSPDGKRLGSGSDYGVVLTWDVSQLLLPLPKARLTKQQVAERWADLLGDDGARAFQAVDVLAKAPADSLLFLRKNLRPAAPREIPIERWIADLDSKEFAVRRKASDELARIGLPAEKALRKARAGRPPLEVQRRLDALLRGIERLKAIASPPRGELLRQLRALEVLERIGDREAEVLLERLARGAADSPLTEEALLSLGRLRSRQPR